MIFNFDKKFYLIRLFFIFVIFINVENCLAFTKQAVIEVIESNDAWIVFEVKPYELKFIEQSINGESFEIPQIKDYQWLTTPGKPQLPSAAVLIGIPIRSVPSIQILDYQSTSLDAKNIYPAPQMKITGDTDEKYLIEQFYLDQESYSENSFYPAELAQITSINMFRQQRIARVEFHPVQYNPVTKQLRKIERLKFAVLFNQTVRQNEQLTQPALSDISKTYENINQHLLVNYPTARKWRASKSTPDQASRLAKRLTNLYDAASSFYKLYVKDSGIYRLDAAYFESVGIDVSFINPQTFKIYNKGKELPIFVFGENDGRLDKDDYVEFYGERNQGDSTYFDPYTDTNIYWLTWGGDFGLRMTSKTLAIEAETEIHDYIEKIRLEQDNIYHEGDNSIALINTELVSGEGWVWRFFYPGDREIISIPITNVSESNVPCRLRIKLRGTTIDPIRPNHHVKVLLNNNLMGDFYFNGTEDYIFDVNFPSVQDGENKLELISVGDTGAQIDQFYLDWIELEYPRQLAANNDALKFTVSNGEDQFAKAILWGFTDPEIQLIDLTNRAMIDNPQIAPGKRLVCKVESAGFDDGSFVKFQINAETISSQWQRGHNLVEIDEVNGKVLTTKHYDTYSSAAESDSMARYIQRLPSGRIVLASIMDDGTQNLTSAAYLALESLGSKFIRTVGFRDSWAMIGRKGAAIGTVPEVLKLRGSGAASVKNAVFVTGTSQDFYLTFSDTLKPFQKFIAVSKKALKYPIKAMLDIPANLTSSQNGADLVIITHKNFLTSAQRLADYRSQQNGLRVKVVDVEDIYDEFNFGLLNPAAIKDFLKYTYENWQAPAPSNVILFGDASWDFKKNLGEDVKENYVPAYGNPVSDNWFVCFDGKGDFLPEMFVGRIPVESVVQAEMVVDKIIAYENTPTGSWKKNGLFITGGFNKSEQRTFMNQTTFLISNFVTPPPASCRAFQINKTTEGYIEGEKKQEVLDGINQGAMWVNFLGHAGSRTWDLMFNHPDIEELSNEDKYPFITSMTCHTGRFANPELNSFGEHFLIAKNKGAIGFWGTTGWGYVFQDDILLKNLFLGTLIDTIHALGEATTFAKIKLWESYGSGIYNESTIHQYTLLGDPLTDLTLPEKPDLTIGTNDVSFAPTSLSEADSFAMINIKIQNWGLAARDTFKLDIFDIQNGQAKLIAGNVPVPFVGLIDSVSVAWDLKDEAGEHTIRVILDVQDNIDEADENNNSQEFPIFVYSSKISVSKPFPFQVISPKNVILQVNNPAIAPAEDTPRYYQFELDTTEAFNSPLLMTSPQIPEGIIVTKWTIDDLRDGTAYFWRCRTVDGVDVGNWELASFKTHSSIAENTWSQQQLDQFSQNQFNQTEVSPQGVQLGTRKNILQVESAGFSDGNYARATINSVPIMEQYRGHNLVVISANNGEAVADRYFDTWESADEANAMANFINSLSDGMYVLCAIKDDGSYNMTEAAYQALESIGSQYCRNVGFRDSWVIIGVKGEPIGSAVELHIPTGQGFATVLDTLINYYPQGAVTSMPIGPADSWRHVSWNEDISSAGTNITLDAIGFNKTLSQWDTLMTDLSNFNGENLKSISARNYPQLKLIANLIGEEGSTTPLLRDWTVSYEPVSDPAIGYQVVTFSTDTLMEGDNLNINLQVFNVGMKVVDTVTIRFSANTQDSGRAKAGDDKILTNIPIDNFQKISYTWESSGRMGNAQLFIEVDPDNQVNELSESNNYYSRDIFVMPDSMKPQVQVTYDGKQIIAGDYVSSQPIILVNVYDNSRFLNEDDTTKINLFLDNNRVSYSANKDVLSLTPITNNDEPRLRGQVRFTPDFKDGDHSLEIFVKDARNNLTYHRDDFQVTSNLKILNVLNYPNPFSDGTEFTFNLTQPSDKVSIKIFTVAGRLIRILDYHHLEAGFHHLYWNGLDQDRNEMANGVYLYKVIARSGDKQAEQIEKLVIMR